MREVDDSLEVMKMDYKKRMDECEERRLNFELKQAKMREQVLKFEKFIQGDGELKPCAAFRHYGFWQHTIQKMMRRDSERRQRLNLNARRTTINAKN